MTADYLMSYKENHLNRLKPGLFVHPLLYRLILQLSKSLVIWAQSWTTNKYCHRNETHCPCFYLFWLIANWLIKERFGPNNSFNCFKVMLQAIFKSTKSTKGNNSSFFIIELWFLCNSCNSIRQHFLFRKG